MPHPDYNQNAVCVHCQYYSFGLCRRHAPFKEEMGLDSNMQPIGIKWPKVRQDDWCGDFSPNDQYFKQIGK